MIRRTKKCALIGAAVVCACCASAKTARAKVTIELDYSLDTNGFFLPKDVNPFGFDGDVAKAVLNRAAQTYSDRFKDNLTEVTDVPGFEGGDWTPIIRDPATGAQVEAALNTVPANVIKIYAGGRALPGTTLGIGGPGGLSYGYYPGVPESEAWRDNVLSRGQNGALATPATDFGRWGGAITFDSVGTNWHIAQATTGLTGSKSDLFSVALHELAHLLGVGTADSWTALVSGGFFNGAKASELNGGPIQTTADGAHWRDGTRSPVGIGGALQETALDPSITSGTRKRLTLLDWAALDDLGWDLAGMGDADADGAVAFSDLVALAQNYGVTTGLARWSEGDFNEDGNVTFNDLVLLAQNYGIAAAPGSMELAPVFGPAFAQDWEAARDAALVGVPEPTVPVIVAGVGMLVMRRRRY